jgi:hypothetical protein
MSENIFNEIIEVNFPNIWKVMVIYVENEFKAPNINEQKRSVISYYSQNS